MYITTPTQALARFLPQNRGEYCIALVFIFGIILPSCFCNYSPAWLLKLPVSGIKPISASQLNTSGVSSVGTQSAPGSASEQCSSHKDSKGILLGTAPLLPLALPWQFYYYFAQKAFFWFGSIPPTSFCWSVVHLVPPLQPSKLLLQKSQGFLGVGSK